jgi:glutamine synthetase
MSIPIWPWLRRLPAVCGASTTGNAYKADGVPRIPSTLADAIDGLASSEVAAEAFGPDVHHHLLNTARQEWATANRVVTDWELARNFERI